MLIGFTGFQGSGKDTAYSALYFRGYEKINFADPIKDACAVIFNWDRKLLEGDTEESRIWRETVDVYWAEKLNRPDFTPRKALEDVGIKMRDFFDPNIWIDSVDSRVQKSCGFVAFTGVRFYDEINYINLRKGVVFRIKRPGPEPEWYNDAFEANQTNNHKWFKEKWNIPQTEYRWIGGNYKDTIINDGTKEDLYLKVIEKVKAIGGLSK